MRKGNRPPLISSPVKGMAVVAARATRLPIYSSFAKEGNLSDLFVKGEAISTLFNVVGMAAGIQLASTICSSMQGNKIEECSNLSNSNCYAGNIGHCDWDKVGMCDNGIRKTFVKDQVLEG